MTGRHPVFRLGCALLLLSVLPAAQAASSGMVAELAGNVAVQGRYFAEDPRDNAQPDGNLSLSLEPEWAWQWRGGDSTLVVRPFVRLDQHDEERTHVDLREAMWTHAGDGWEFGFGIGKVFWGVTEAVHLVDIVNQTDLIENPDGEQKLGQPMLRIAVERDWGTTSLFVLPWFRERTFPGRDGRLRSHPLTIADRAIYENSREDRHVDLALRWAHFVGDWDIGLAHFHGTGREPTLVPRLDGAGRPVLVPRYQIIDQTSLDLQATKGDWLWKLEALHRSGQGDSFWAASGGFEYTVVGFGGSDGDLGLLLEAIYDDRGDAASTPFNRELFAGFRWTANDTQSTELLAGVIVDWDSDARTFNVEASRRIDQHWVVSLQLRAWSNVPADDPAASFSRDDYVEMEWVRYF